jgi:site-specific recombinase
MLGQLERIAAQPDTSQIDNLAHLVEILRPKRVHQHAMAVDNVRTLTQLLRGNPGHASALRHYLLRMLSVRRQTSLYTDVGILSNDGFFTELARRLAYRLLPPALDENYLSDCLDRLLHKRTDYLWIKAVPTEDWLALFDTLADADIVDAPPVAATDNGNSNSNSNGNGNGNSGGDLLDRQKTLAEMLEAVQTLSYRISAIGLEPSLIRIHPDLETFGSPFLMQNVELHTYLQGYTRYLAGDPTLFDDAKQILVMLDQCDTVVTKIRKNALHLGTSIALTYLLVRLTQSIERLRKLLMVLDLTPAIEAPPTAIDHRTPSQGTNNTDAIYPPPTTQIETRRAAAVALALELVETHNHKYALHQLFASNINLLARNVTENASRTGEHYIAEDRLMYRAMFRSSAGAGVIIGFMAMLKILASYLRAAPLAEAFLYSLNYSFGFMLIHVLHFTVATKQPAMTASRIAAGLHNKGGKEGRNIDIDSMAELIIKVVRTQFVAVLGNLATAMPTAYLIAWVYFYLTGHHLVSPEKAQHLLHDINPFASLALFHAMIAGVCLFLAGLISGYYDNHALYVRMAQRVNQLRWLRTLLGEHRQARLALYLEDNLGGLMGNFYFGILLGTLGTVGYMLGLPIDIRHVTFSSANFSTALVGLGHQVSAATVATSIFGILCIGAVNLLVSFGLALFVALRSRQVRFNQSGALMKTLGRRFFSGPQDFFIAPKIDTPYEKMPPA